MNAKFTHLLCILTCLFSSNAQCSLISFNGYTLNESTNIIEGNDGLEWLQWSQTINISPLQALDTIAKTYQGGGWRLANNAQMATLLNSFDFGITFDSDYRTTQSKRGVFDPSEDIETDPFMQFTRLFGNTYTLNLFDDSPEPLTLSYAQFGEDTDNIQKPNRVFVQGDFYNSQFDRGNYSEIYLSGLIDNMNVAKKILGVALVRDIKVQDDIIKVNEPSSLFLAVLAFLALLCNKQYLVGKLKLQTGRC